MTRPKFLLITADQHCADRIGVAGRRMKTPYLDEVSRNGTRFTAAIARYVSRQPARASIPIGQLPRPHGVHDNGVDRNPAIGEDGFVRALAAAGHDAGAFGAAHSRPISSSIRPGRRNASALRPATARTGPARRQAATPASANRPTHGFARVSPTPLARSR